MYKNIKIPATTENFVMLTLFVKTSLDVYKSKGKSVSKMTQEDSSSHIYY